MDFMLSKEHQMLQKMYREFTENEVRPIAQEVDEEERFPEETVEKMAKLGMMGIPYPKEYGGAGADNLAYAIAIEELSKACATTSVIVAAHTSLCSYPIFAYGNEEQKRKYMPKLTSGEWLGAFGLTEPVPAPMLQASRPQQSRTVITTSSTAVRSLLRMPATPIPLWYSP